MEKMASSSDTNIDEKLGQMKEDIMQKIDKKLAWSCRRHHCSATSSRKTNDVSVCGGCYGQACLVLSQLLLTMATKLNPSDALQEGRIDCDEGECYDACRPYCHLGECV
jgi:hypothetical protein